MNFVKLIKKGEDFEKLKDRIYLEDSPNWTRGISIEVQYTKIVNYFGFMLTDEWGGNYREHFNIEKIREGRSKFLIWADQFEEPWLKIDPSNPIGPESCKMTDYPDRMLGKPDEAYIGAGDEVVTLALASKILCISPRDLLRLKLELTLDHLVVGKALTNQLSRSVNHV